MAIADFSQIRTDVLPAGLYAARRYESAGVELATPGSRIGRLMSDSSITRRRWKPGDHLFRAGDEFHSFHVLQTGFAKTCCVSEDGEEQTTGFHLRGDMLGLDAVATGTHGCDAVALDACEALAIPYNAVITHSQGNPDLVRELHHAFSNEIRNDRDLMLNRGSLSAEGRVAAYLLDMSVRFASRGYSATELHLHLTRHEIGSMLGLKLETVSRAFSRFARLGLITVNLREFVLLDRDGLLDIISRSASTERAGRKSTGAGRTCQAANEY